MLSFRLMWLTCSAPNSNPLYFFWSGRGDPRSARKAFQRSFWKLFKLAKISREDGSLKRCHPYMFRDTFAVELLLAGNPMDQVSLLLGHSSVKIMERHRALDFVIFEAMACRDQADFDSRWWTRLITLISSAS